MCGAGGWGKAWKGHGDLSGRVTEDGEMEDGMEDAEDSDGGEVDDRMKSESGWGGSDSRDWNIR